MKFLRKLLTVVVILAAVSVGMLFALQNKTPVPLDVLVYTFEPRSLALWVLAAFAIGGILGMLACSAIMLRQRASLGSARRQLARSRAEVGELRDTASEVTAP
jgi:uncharacterized membrane protein YciS (DUF1049 family)